MIRYKIVIEYCGTGFSGWQWQSDAISIQQTIEIAIFKFCAENTTVFAAGRTDAGVHATGQVAHFDLCKRFDESKIRNALNHFLRAHRIAIISCNEEDPERFHARFSAIARHYDYVILNRIGPTALDVDRVWWIRDHIDIELMKTGASFLIGNHDFTSFRSSQCQSKSPIKTLTTIDIVRRGEIVKLNFTARSFLHNMVRNLVGSLLLVGIGKWPPKKIEEVLNARDRRVAAAKAPAAGLYLSKIDY